MTAAPNRTRRRNRSGRAATKEPKALDMGVLPRLLGYHLRCAQVAMFRQFNQRLGSYEISPPQLGALVLIEANPGISQSAVAGALRFDRSTLVQIIDRLEGRGLVMREASAHDRRSHALKLTEAGAETLAGLKIQALDQDAELADDLSEEERQALIGLLRRVYDAPES
jgi:DNA-binding MarR family transcriptional regulator